MFTSKSAFGKGGYDRELNGFFQCAISFIGLSINISPSIDIFRKISYCFQFERNFLKLLRILPTRNSTWGKETLRNFAWNFIEFVITFTKFHLNFSSNFAWPCDLLNRWNKYYDLCIYASCLVIVLPNDTLVRNYF